MFPVHLPPLRERIDDIVPLAERLLRGIAAELGRPKLALADEARVALKRAAWPGNVRELANTLERAAILADGSTITESVLFAMPGRPKSASTTVAAPGMQTLTELERQAIAAALERNDGNRRKAAEELGIGLRTLYDKLERYDLS